ncbi:hypothetical protein pipiens_001897 [Culex pipiens pipiens]|uniref:Uncharacterized protein n=1 Tax=Culex pipiens pipiens TaxID=38569 RepID=A0ABD1DSB2_CULPP
MPKRSLSTCQPESRKRECLFPLRSNGQFVPQGVTGFGSRKRIFWPAFRRTATHRTTSQMQLPARDPQT